MSNLKQLKEQIKSVSSTGKITKAMKLVSTVKLRQAEELAKNSKYYESALKTAMSNIAYTIEKYDAADYYGDIFSVGNFKDNDIKSVDIIFITSDRGMCGGFNSKTIKTVLGLVDQYKSKGYKVRLKSIGKKGNAYFSYRGDSIVDFITSSNPSYESAKKFISDSLEDYKSGLTNEIVLVHNGFKNKIIQEIKINQLLPFDTSIVEPKGSDSLVEIEPDNPKEVLENLISKYIEYSLYYAMIDSIAAEHSARMQAMDTASKNANDLSKTLNTKYNKSRQAAVTNELIEIISGVEAMK